MPVTGIMAGGQLVSGIISGISGLSQKAKAKKMAKDNVRPVYEIPTEIKENQAKAKAMADTGLQGTQLAAAQKNIERSQQSAISQATDRRGGLNAVGAIQQGSNDAYGNLAAQDTAQRMANISNLMNQNKVMASYRDKAFGYNQDQKYQEQAAAVRAMTAAGNQNLGNAANSILGAGATAAAGGLFGGQKQPTPNTSNTFKQTTSELPQANPDWLSNMQTNPINKYLTGQGLDQSALADPSTDPSNYSDNLPMLNFIKK
jgi:hypothetical protein